MTQEGAGMTREEGRMTQEEGRMTQEEGTTIHCGKITRLFFTRAVLSLT